MDLKLINFRVLNKGVKESDEVLERICEQFNLPILTSNGEMQQLKTYEIPTYIEFVSEIPRKKGTDKVDYKFLEQDAIEKLNLEKKDSKVLKIKK